MLLFVCSFILSSLFQPGGDPLVLCFVDFSTPAQAAVALDALQGENKKLITLNTYVRYVQSHLVAHMHCCLLMLFFVIASLLHFPLFLYCTYIYTCHIFQVIFLILLRFPFNLPVLCWLFFCYILHFEILYWSGFIRKHIQDDRLNVVPWFSPELVSSCGNQI